MFKIYFEENHEGEEFDWKKFIEDPKTKEQDAQQDDPDWQKQWKEDIGGGDKGENPEPPKPN